MHNRTLKTIALAAMLVGAATTLAVPVAARAAHEPALMPVHRNHHHGLHLQYLLPRLLLDLTLAPHRGHAHGKRRDGHSYRRDDRSGRRGGRHVAPPRDYSYGGQQSRRNDRGHY